MLLAVPATIRNARNRVGSILAQHPIARMKEFCFRVIVNCFRRVARPSCAHVLKDTGIT